jgi:acylphosphatase
MPELIPDMSSRRIRVHVSGDVQGVGFRWYCREAAMGQGITGSVRNLPDGRVEAEFEGDSEAVDDMVEWCRKGPKWARVDAVDVEEGEPLGEGGFRIER